MAEQTINPDTTSERDKDPIALAQYANNVLLEASAWDLKILFGQLDQRTSPAETRFHTAVIIPWTQAKLALYWLQLHVAVHEVDYGKIRLREDLLPPEPDPPPEAESNPTLKEFYQFVRKLREDFIASLQR